MATAPAIAGEGQSQGEHAKPVLIELFTSQGCASCPKANAFLGKLGHEDAMITLTYAVGYWDYLGWKDQFAKPEFADRQKAYAARFRKSVYTPQMVVDGAAHTSGLKAAEVRALIGANPIPGGTKIDARRRDGALRITLYGPAPAAPADVWLAQYEPGPIYVEVKGGENAGARIPHYNLVKQIVRLGAWTGAPVHYAAECTPACAVIVQEEDGGRVIAARDLTPQNNN
ncbi:MAG TPA: DUF1223 domain-containing protein [Caulobacterales bacterium]|nr:DUF1223 domain-containing protein [Caulobacterales bacterium]